MTKRNQLNMQKRRNKIATALQKHLVEVSKSKMWSEISQATDELYTARQDLIGALIYIDTTATTAQNCAPGVRGKVLYEALYGWDGTLMGIFTHFARLCDQWEAPIPQLVIDQVQQRVIGIKRALNDGDGGAHLTQQAAQRSALYDRISSIHSNWTRPRDPVVDYLFDSANRLRPVHSSWSATAYAIRTEIESEGEGINPVQRQALEEIKSRGAKAGEYIKRVWDRRKS